MSRPVVFFESARIYLIVEVFVLRRIISRVADFEPQRRRGKCRVRSRESREKRMTRAGRTAVTFTIAESRKGSVIGLSVFSGRYGSLLPRAGQSDQVVQSARLQSSRALQGKYLLRGNITSNFSPPMDVYELECNRSSLVRYRIPMRRHVLSKAWPCEGRRST